MITKITGLNPKFKKVDKYLIRGPRPSVKDIFQLKKQGVTQIYDFRHYSSFGMKFIERVACKLAGVKYIRKPFSFLSDKAPQLNDFEEVAKSVKENGEKGGKTFFHCNSGRHRTSQMATFYDITRGELLNEYRKNNLLQYKGQVLNSMINQVYRADFFNRQIKHTKTFNPIKILRENFNNKVVKKTQEAHKKFMEMFLGGYKLDSKFIIGKK